MMNYEYPMDYDFAPTLQKPGPRRRSFESCAGEAGGGFGWHGTPFRGQEKD